MGRHLASLPVIPGVTRFTLHQIINDWVSQKAAQVFVIHKDESKIKYLKKDKVPLYTF